MEEIELNPEQRKAVEHGRGPLLIVAGPGSGKTRVITERIVYLLEHVPGLAAQSILALTYTDKAAEEMKSRVRRRLTHLETLPHISTFHAFAYHALRERHFDRRLLDRVDVWIFLRRRMGDLGLEFYRKLAEPGAFLHDLNDFFSRCQDELIEPDDFDAYVAKVEKDFLRRAAPEPAASFEEQEVRKLNELARVFRKSRDLIAEAGCSSLGSLIPETVLLFDRQPEVLRRYRERFSFVLVDEFQDTNFAQVELLRRLVARPLNITAVGDDDQAIYRFRGASHGAFEMFASAFGRHAAVNLHRNYRSTKKILRAADAVIARNERSACKKTLTAEKGEGQKVILLQSPDYRSEAAWIGEEVARLVGRGMPFRDIAILYRAHHYRDLLVEEFRRSGFPFAIRGLSLLSIVILRDLVAYLNLIHSPYDNISLTRVLLAPGWGFREELTLEIRKQAARQRCSFYDALEASEQGPFGKDLEATGWRELKMLFCDLRQAAERTPVAALLDLLVERLGLSFVPGDPDAAYVEAFRKFLAAWEEKGKTRKLREFMEYFRYFVEAGGKIEAPELENPSDAVQMMTAHAAKGLEFPVVFILSVASRRFPSTERRPVIEFPDELRKAPAPPANIHTQEERRLFYVALTRAMERLYVSSVVKPGKTPSRFVDDLLSDPVVAARDIDRIEVPEIPVEASDAAPPPARRGRREKGHPGLFSGADVSGRVHPPIAEWSGRPPSPGPDEKLRLSASAVEDYLSCPLKFKFSHYFKVPSGPQAALTFGNIMHTCVRRYFELRKQKLLTFEEMEKFYLESWNSAGFEDAYQEESYRRAGLEQLRLFVEQQNSSAMAVDGIELEKHFSLDLGDVVLEGRIDQVNPVEAERSRGTPAVELVDYKTGQPRSQKEVDKSMQLSVYALAAERQMRLNPVRLTFHYLADGQKVSTVRTPKDLERTVEKIRDVAGEIRSQRFQPTPGYACKWCDFVPVCPAHEEQ